MLPYCFNNTYNIFSSGFGHFFSNSLDMFINSVWTKITCGLLFLDFYSFSLFILYFICYRFYTTDQRFFYHSFLHIHSEPNIFLSCWTMNCIEDMTFDRDIFFQCVINTFKGWKCNFQNANVLWCPVYYTYFWNFFGHNHWRC